MPDQLQVRIPPHSKDAEESVLGAILLDKDAVIAVAEFLTPDDFYDDKLKEIYISAICFYYLLPNTQYLVPNTMSRHASLIFLGTPEFALPSLKLLHGSGFNIKAVITNPDRPLGSKQTRD